MTYVRAVDPKVLKMTDEQRAAYNLDSLEGSQVNALVGSNPSKTDPSKIYNNILSFEPVKTKLELLSADDMNVVRANPVDAPATAPEEDESVEAFTASLDRDAAASAEKKSEELSEEELEAKLAAMRANKAQEETK